MIDLCNGLLELGGGVCVWFNVRRLLADKVVKGVDSRVVLFFAIWGIWNLFYYPALHQWFSFFGGLAICAGNFVWIGLAIKYRRE